MSSNKRLITVGGIVLIAGLILMFPARVAYQAFVPDGVRFAGIGGTLWSGSATEGQIGALYLRNVRWSMRPVALLTGKLAFELSADPAGGFIEADVALSPGGSVRLTDVEGGVSISAMQSVIPAPGIEGNLRVQFDDLLIEDGLPTAAVGTVEVFGLVARGLSPTPIGDFRAELVSTDGGISGSLEDLAGVLDIAGSIRVSTDRSYLLQGLVAPKPAASGAIVDQLRLLGSPNERGQRQFRLEGRL